MAYALRPLMQSDCDVCVAAICNSKYCQGFYRKLIWVTSKCPSYRSLLLV